jgi:hypothetical protein
VVADFTNAALSALFHLVNCVEKVRPDGLDDS